MRTSYVDTHTAGMHPCVSRNTFTIYEQRHKNPPSNHRGLNMRPYVYTCVQVCMQVLPTLYLPHLPSTPTHPHRYTQAAYVHRHVLRYTGERGTSQIYTCVWQCVPGGSLKEGLVEEVGVTRGQESLLSSLPGASGFQVPPQWLRFRQAEPWGRAQSP